MSSPVLPRYQEVESRHWSELNAEAWSELLASRTQPLLIKGMIDDWPILNVAKQSIASQLDFLKSSAAASLIFKSEAPPTSQGRFFYTEDFKDLNFSQTAVPLPEFLAQLSTRIDFPENEKTFCYMASTSLGYCFPTLSETHILPLTLSSPIVSAWLGSQSIAATHFDVPDNLACNALGRRTFTLFPPDQINNLYIGPMHLTPAGQQVSLVNVAEPDLEQFPKFSEAIANGYQVTLEPGETLFIPSLWWHNVQAHEDVNLLINFWWRNTPAFLGQPMDALKHALLNIKPLPTEQRKHWQSIFNYFVFNDDPTTHDHIPVEARSYLEALDENSARQLRAELIKALNK